jgi:hypothetical protein
LEVLPVILFYRCVAAKKAIGPSEPDDLSIGVGVYVVNLYCRNPEEGFEINFKSAYWFRNGLVISG